MNRGVYTGTVAVQAPRMIHSVVLETFTAAETAAMTGVSQDEQRDWRKRGFLPRLTGGKAAFDLKAITTIMVAKRMNGLGIGPQSGWRTAESVGAILYAQILNGGGSLWLTDSPIVDDPLGVGPGRLVHATDQALSARWAIVSPGGNLSIAAEPEELARKCGTENVVLDLHRLSLNVTRMAPRSLARIETTA